MANRASPRTNRLSRNSAQWRSSTTGRPVSAPPTDGYGETDWDGDWLTDGVAAALSRSGASTAAGSYAPGAHATTNGRQDGRYEEHEMQRYSHEADESTIGVIPEERCDSRTSDDHDQWQDGHKPHEAVSGLIQPHISPRHAPSPDCQPSTTRRLAERMGSHNLKRLSGCSSRIIKNIPGRESRDESEDGAPMRYSELVEKRASKFSERLKTPPSEARERDSNLVLWKGPEDPENPINWSRWKKWLTTYSLGSVTFCVTLSSSILSPGTEDAARHFGVSTEVMVLSTALFILGFAFGPIIWGPMSEVYGRKVPMFGMATFEPSLMMFVLTYRAIGLFIFAIFQIPVALAPNVETLFVCRFLSGFFGCSPLCIVGGAFADFWAPADRGVAASIFSAATFLGPTMGPIIGGFIAQTPSLTWRWCAWVTLFAVALFGTICWFVYDESLGSVLLQRRARRLRFETKNWALHAPADEVEVSMKDIFNKYLTKPVKMLFWEPILLLMTIYISFIYGILYLFFETYPISFIQQRGWSLGMGGLPFCAVMVGVVIGCFINYIFIKTRYVRILKQHGRVQPEERLVPMMVGSILLPIGLFWFAWTSNPEITWIPQVLAGIPAGVGILLIFLQGINYIIDVYKMFSNSAIAGNTIIRSLFGAGFPMFAIYMYQGLGVTWATNVLGFISVGLIPMPILFFVYGARIRKMSRFSPKM